MPDRNFTAELNALLAEESVLHQELLRLRERLRILVEDFLKSIPTEAGGAATQFELIVAFLRSRGNIPQTTKAIIRATGITRASLSQILYRTHKHSFIRVEEGNTKLWALSERVMEESRQLSLFAAEGDLSGIDAADCCAEILRDNNNRELSVLTMTREALRRGYLARTTGDDDSVLFSTAKSFWARLGRDDRFVDVRPFVYRLRVSGDPPPKRRRRRRIVIEDDFNEEASND